MIITMDFVGAGVTIEAWPVYLFSMEALLPGSTGSREGWSMAVSLVGLLALTTGAVILPMKLGLK